MDALWGLIIIACGVFVGVYGNQLFRLVLAALGFGLGAILGWWLAGGETELMRILISLAAGGIGAVLLYSLFRIGIYIAGGILGLILASLLTALLGLTYTSVGTLILLAGAGLVSFFGRRLGNLIIILATAAAGAFQVVYGVALIFGGQLARNTSPVELLSTPLALVIFGALVALSALSQIENNRIRTRFLGNTLLKR